MFSFSCKQGRLQILTLTPSLEIHGKQNRQGHSPADSFEIIEPLPGQRIANPGDEEPMW